MLYITMDFSASREDWHLKVMGRIINGLKHLEKDGYKVERYSEFADGPTLKWLLTIAHTDTKGDK